MSPVDQKPARVSAKNNPFVVQRTDAIPFDFRDTKFEGMDDFFGHASGFGFRGAILGKHGRGKTTLLCDLNSHIQKRNHECELVFIPRDRNGQCNVIEEASKRGHEGAIILVDGIERLPFISRHRLISASKLFGGFIATTHRPGRLKTLVRCRTSPESLLGILESLGTTNPKLSAHAVSLWSAHRGNVRSVLRELYDLHSEGLV